MTTILVGTYNMSFSGDQGLNPNRIDVFESEAAFHKSNKSGDWRKFWIKALENVEKFVQQPTAGFIGFQEINKTDEGSGTGSDAIKSAIKAIKPSFEVITEEIVVNPKQKPAITIAWDTSKLGNEEEHKIVDLDYTPDESNIKAGAQKGRPMLMVLTDKGYLLISLHAPNYPISYKGQFSTLRKTIQTNITNFLNGRPVSGDKIFIVGDFNDRFDALKEFTINGTTLTYDGKAPRSCCHNWDSTCTDVRFSQVTDFSNDNWRKTNARVDIGTCKPPTYQDMINKGELTIEKFEEIKAASKAAANKAEANGKPRPPVISEASTIALAGPGLRFELEEEGNIENYRYYADKVFGAKPAGDIHIFPEGRSGPSKESDHEMVVAEFEISASGGRRRAIRRKTQRRRKNYKKTKRSRKY